MKLVEFENGKFGVRNYWLFGWHFVDLESPEFSWSRRNHWFKGCEGSREEAIRGMHRKCIKYKIVGGSNES